MEGIFQQAFAGLGNGLRLPDLWQGEAISALIGGEDVIVSAPTGAGKTFIFESLVRAHKIPAAGRQAIFTVPTRALANEKWREWRRLGWKTGIATGDLAVDTDAPVLVATLETQRERFLAGKGPQLLVVDEYQMIGDRQRGLNYELALALAPAETRLLLLSGSVANPGEVAAWLKRLGRPVRVVETVERPVPLEEIPVEGLPRTAPPKYANFWHRLALGVLLSQGGPLLIFAPHRRSAEKIARKIAEVLPEDDPIRLGEKRLEQACSAELARLLKRRVAFHHSGLTYAERAAIIEPLAKAGQLRVVVATMGLAAGINFSVRSVFIAGTTYQEGPYETQVAPDELLQMIGRAGRRGLDESGFFITGRDSPHLNDARRVHLRRHNELDWPTLIRRMDLASSQGISPVAAARELRDRLFSVPKLPLGFRKEGVEEGVAAAGLFDLKPMRREIRGAAGDWEPYREGREGTAPLREALAWTGGAWAPAASLAEVVRDRLPEGTRLCRLDEKGENVRRYGFEMAVATGARETGYQLTRSVARLAGSGKGDLYTYEEAAALLPGLLEPVLHPARVVGLVERGRSLALLADPGETRVPVYRDSGDHALLAPLPEGQVIPGAAKKGQAISAGAASGKGQAIHAMPVRKVEVEAETHFTDADSGDSFELLPGSPAHSWRRLGLIEANGRPTDRGRVFCLFQGGEGLAVAAALEDESYPVDEIVRHLANLRAGHRFDLDTVRGAGQFLSTGGSERLAAACRRAYGPVDHEGYLSLGLPPHYGENASEVIALHLGGKLGLLLQQAISLDFGPGDVERALIEWLSLLRHLRNAPELAIPRWTELQAAARAELTRHAGRTPFADLPTLPANVLQRPVRHGIAYASI